MKTKTFFLTLTVSIILLTTTTAPAEIRVYFSPKRNTIEKNIKQIDNWESKREGEQLPVPKMNYRNYKNVHSK